MTLATVAIDFAHAKITELSLTKAAQSPVIVNDMVPTTCSVNCTAFGSAVVVAVVVAVDGAETLDVAVVVVAVDEVLLVVGVNVVKVSVVVAVVVKLPLPPPAVRLFANAKAESAAIATKTCARTAMANRS